MTKVLLRSRVTGPHPEAPPTYLHGLGSVDEPVILRTSDEQIHLGPWGPLQCSGWGLSEVLAVDHWTPVVEGTAHSQQLHQVQRGVMVYTDFILKD